MAHCKQALDYLRSEAARGRREDYERFLAAVPDREPIEIDHIHKSTP
jgi:hypothetical protein